MRPSSAALVLAFVFTLAARAARADERAWHNDAATACDGVADPDARNVCIRAAYALLADDAAALRTELSPRGVHVGSRSLSPARFVRWATSRGGVAAMLDLPPSGVRLVVRSSVERDGPGFELMSRYGCGRYPALQLARGADGRWALRRLHMVSVYCE